MERPTVLTLRKLRKKYGLSVHEVAERMGVEDNYLEHLEERGDCTVNEFRRYAYAVGGDARCSLKMADGQLFLMELGYHSPLREIPDVHGVDMPSLPKNVAEFASFEAKLTQLDDEAYKVFSDQSVDKRSRALASTVRNCVSLLRRTSSFLRPRLEVMESMFRALSQVDSSPITRVAEELLGLKQENRS